MKKAANIYTNDPEAIRRNSRASKASRRAARPAALPRWAVFAAIIGMTFMLCLTINYRAFSEMSREVREHEMLTNNIEDLTDENLALQEEIHNLKSDSKLIEREAQKLGLRRSN